MRALAEKIYSRIFEGGDSDAKTLRPVFVNAAEAAGLTPKEFQKHLVTRLSGALVSVGAGREINATELADSHVHLPITGEHVEALFRLADEEAGHLLPGAPEVQQILVS